MSKNLTQALPLNAQNDTNPTQDAEYSYQEVARHGVSRETWSDYLTCSGKFAYRKNEGYNTPQN